MFEAAPRSQPEFKALNKTETGGTLEKDGRGVISIRLTMLGNAIYREDLYRL